MPQEEALLQLESLKRSDEVRRMIGGFEISQCIFTAVQLNLPALLEKNAKHCDELAHITGAHSDSLCRLLKVLVHLEFFVEVQPQFFQLAPQGQYLLDQGPLALQSVILLQASERGYGSWKELLYGIRTGKSVFEQVYGEKFFSYLNHTSTLAEIFDKAMTQIAGIHHASIVNCYDFAALETLVDIGGGEGSLLAKILQHYPKLKGILFEQPRLLEKAKHFFEKENLLSRCEIITGNFLERVPAGADAYLIKNIINILDDDQAIQLLRHCHQAMIDEGRILVIQRLASEDSSLDDKIMQLYLLVLYGSGARMRTQEEMERLYQVAGFQISKIVPTGLLKLVEGKKK